VEAGLVRGCFGVHKIQCIVGNAYSVRSTTGMFPRRDVIPAPAQLRIVIPRTHASGWTSTPDGEGYKLSTAHLESAYFKNYAWKLIGVINILGIAGLLLVVLFWIETKLSRN